MRIGATNGRGAQPSGVAAAFAPTTALATRLWSGCVLPSAARIAHVSGSSACSTSSREPETCRFIARRASGGTHPTLVRACSSVYEAAWCVPQAVSVLHQDRHHLHLQQWRAPRIDSLLVAQRDVAPSSFLRGPARRLPAGVHAKLCAEWQSSKSAQSRCQLRSLCRLLQQRSLPSTVGTRQLGCVHMSVVRLSLFVLLLKDIVVVDLEHGAVWCLHASGVFRGFTFPGGLAVCGTRARTKASLSVFSPSNSSCRTSHPRADCVPHGPMPTWRLRTHRHSL